MSIIPRPYQNRAVNAWFDYYNAGNRGHTGIGLPCGTGKSIIPALVIKKCMEQWPGFRAAIVTHVKELIGQNATAARLATPLLPLGICSAGLNKWEPYFPVIFGGIGSVYKRAAEIGHIDVLFVDEGHMISNDGNSMYRLFIDALLAINPKMKICIMTATMYRMGQGHMTQGENALIDDIILDLTVGDEFLYFLDEYYLSPLTPKPTSTNIDVSGFGLVGGEYHQGHVADAAMQIMQHGVAETLAYGQDRTKWKIFGAGVENCYELSRLYARAGISNVVVHSNSKKYPITNEERDARIDAYKSDMVRAIISNNILLTGFDCPAIDLIANFRATTSVPLHVQMLGRGTRQCFHPDYGFDLLQQKEMRYEAMMRGRKPNGCMVLDFAGNVGRLGRINNPKIPNPKGSGGGEAPQKVCQACGEPHHPTAKVCEVCGTEFIFKIKIKKTAADKTLIDYGEVEEEANIEALDVRSWNVAVHRKKGDNPPTMKVTYWCGKDGLRPVVIYVPFSSKSGYGKHKSRDWWRLHFGDSMFPSSTEEAVELSSKCRMPRKIKVDTGGKWADITSYTF